jgi:hypothetical protein
MTETPNEMTSPTLRVWQAGHIWVAEIISASGSRTLGTVPFATREEAKEAGRQELLSLGHDPEAVTAIEPESD